MDLELFVNKDCIFQDRQVFDKSYIPKIVHRDDQMLQIANCLQYILKDSIAADIAVFGKRGTGKTLTIRYVVDELTKRTSKVKTFYISLKKKRTAFKATEQIVNTLTGRPLRGKGDDEGYRMIFDYIKTLDEKYIIFILDEINEVEDIDGLLYSLLRTHEVYGGLNGKEISYIFITNDMNFPKNLSEGTKSSFCGVTKRIFPPYNADQLKDILRERVEKGLKPGVCSEEILSFCAAIGAQELGDARETIKIMEKAAEIANEHSHLKLTEQHIKDARKQIEFESVAGVIRTLPKQLKCLALACIKDIKYGLKTPKHTSTTASVYLAYKSICGSVGCEVLTQRRITDLLMELETLGIIDAQVIFSSRGKPKHISTSAPIDTIEQALTEDPTFEQFKPAIFQTKFS